MVSHRPTLTFASALILIGTLTRYIDLNLDLNLNLEVLNGLQII